MRGSTLLSLTEFILDRLEPTLQLFDLPSRCLELGRNGLALLPRTVNLTVRTIFNPAYVAFLRHTLLLGLEL